ncbi:MAG TPA: sulfurtransferase-like selenium metabolism protein YedF [Feifaniaceae bacterium]|nr:sulfurtransferase-like selenium metabolism protein YedF [Feifaniaceae bacterium]
MAKQIDARGLLCPKPVILAKKELDAGGTDLTVLVDNAVAVQNLTRLAQANQRELQSRETEGGFAVQITGKSKAGETVMPNDIQCAPAAGYAVFIGKDHVGEGDGILGYNLMKMFLYTLSESEDIPLSVLFMNGGVKLPAGGEQQVIDSINALIGKGVEVLVCGTCLNFYGLTDQLKSGKVSNMYEILSRMQAAGKVITV